MGKGSGTCNDRPSMVAGGAETAPPSSAPDKIDAAPHAGEQTSLLKSAAGMVGKVADAALGTNKKQAAEARAEQQRLAGKQGTFKSDDKKHNLDRPERKCIECEYSFLDREAFHWTDKGPVHGWGKYNDKKTCRFKKKQDNFLRCQECDMVIYTNQPYHKVKDGAIHGKGKFKDHGTCLIAHRKDISDALNQVAHDFFHGTIDSEVMLTVMEETATIEENKAKQVEKATKNYYKSSSSSSSSPSSTGGAFGAEEWTGMFDAEEDPSGIEIERDKFRDTLLDIDGDMTLGELRNSEAESHGKALKTWDSWFAKYEDDETIDDIFAKTYEEEAAMDQGGIDTSQLDPDDPCWCASGKKLYECHGDLPGDFFDDVAEPYDGEMSEAAMAHLANEMSLRELEDDDRQMVGESVERDSELADD